MKRLFGLIFIFFVFSCVDRTGIPDDIIPMESMQKIMADIILANNYSSDFLQKDTTKKDKVQANQDLMAIVFKIHHTTAADFKKSLVFYESRPDLSKKIFDSLEAYNSRHRKDDYKPGATHPVKKPPLGRDGKPVLPNGKPVITPHPLMPNQHTISPHKTTPYQIPSHPTPVKKTQNNPPVKQVPARVQ
jgi:hypothetical protein